MPIAPATPISPPVIDLGQHDPVLVFGGPYSNLEATVALQGVATRLAIPPSRVLCTGDVVAYCADADATAELVQSWGIHVIAGNCEEQLGADADSCACGFGAGSACDLLARNWYEYARRQVTGDRKAWMAALPRRSRFRLAGFDLEMVHGGFDLINRWVFASTKEAIREELARPDADIVLAGHCGLPFLAEEAGRAWFNPGVIGIPANDATPDVWYGLLRPTATSLHLSTHRLTYGYRDAARKLADAGFADPYARALEDGLWPSLDVLPQAERAMTGQPLAAISRTLAKPTPAKRMAAE
jgi:predicted phosphodiesterase